jgi:SAM-dependent methyltransferase
VSVDISEDSLARAAVLLREHGILNVELRTADVYNLPFDEKSFDHVFASFLLEHIGEPVRALAVMRTMLRPGGSITVIEGDHGSAFFYPHSSAAQKAITCQIDIQAASGGNAEIGRELYPLLKAAGYSDVHVSPRMVYVDSSRQGLVEGFTLNTFTAMIEGVRCEAITRNLASAAEFDEGIRGLERAAGSDGVFCYTFFKGSGIS